MPAGGRIPQQRGSGFEDMIQNICDYLKAQNKAWIDKKATSVGFVTDRQSYKNKKFIRPKKLFFKKKSTVDFEGFDSKGYHICFECKNTKNKNSWTYKYDDDTKHQIEYLYTAWSRGCNTFLLIKNGCNEIYKIIPNKNWGNGKDLKIVFRDHKLIEYEQLFDFIMI